MDIVLILSFKGRPFIFHIVMIDWRMKLIYSRDIILMIFRYQLSEYMVTGNVDESTSRTEKTYSITLQFNQTQSQIAPSSSL